jgi:hypothetical protein
MGHGALVTGLAEWLGLLISRQKHCSIKTIDVDPDPSLFCTDPDRDPSIKKQINEKNLDLYISTIL